MSSWSKKLLAVTSILEGDKLVLPPIVLEELLEKFSQTSENEEDTPSNSQLPSPLTFQILNPKTRLITHGGVLEFNSPDEKAYLPQWMYDSLSLSEGDEIVILHKELPKGTWARFRPLGLEYNEIKDYRAAFEDYLRSHYVTLTVGEVLGLRQADSIYKFIVDSLQPENAVRIIDTDLEVEIVPFLESDGVSLSNETGNKRHQRKEYKESEVSIGQIIKGTVLKDEYTYWNLKSIDRSLGVKIHVKILDGGDADLVISTESKPTIEDHLWSDFSFLSEKSVCIQPTNSAYATSEELYIGIHGYGESQTNYELLITNTDIPVTLQEHDDENANKVGYAHCRNCGSWVPERTIILHSSYCERNNIKCKVCGKIMKRGEENSHWHCGLCGQPGDSPEGKIKHQEIYHKRRECSCGYSTDSLPSLAAHKQSDCPNKLITCRFCHNLVKKGEIPTNPRDLLEGLTGHESYCGNRTIDCVKCNQSVSIRNVPMHAKMHEIEKQGRKLPPLCRNVNCTRTVENNTLKLCSVCFGPFWSPANDPMNRKLLTRLARKYHHQLTTGCGHAWCNNQYCAIGASKPLDPNTAASTLVPLLQESQSATSPALYLCVDQIVTRKRMLANILYNGQDGEGIPGEYGIEFCIEAIELSNENLAEARKYLRANAPRRI
ncbi:9756_t:CDS:2 [Ambispora gerdemannii]|uniref:9756_t:CDS:1 n=1 Tax=Ambispora gerdemannii TaxID=144530 RepID=A0A9N8YWJ8_9GLOM|nr:9756_t:CDS:2 [Ambispora gerdemannii]